MGRKAGSGQGDRPAQRVYQCLAAKAFALVPPINRQTRQEYNRDGITREAFGRRDFFGRNRGR